MVNEKMKSKIMNMICCIVLLVSTMMVPAVLAVGEMPVKIYPNNQMVGSQNQNVVVDDQKVVIPEPTKKAYYKKGPVGDMPVKTYPNNQMIGFRPIIDYDFEYESTYSFYQSMDFTAVKKDLNITIRVVNDGNYEMTFNITNLENVSSIDAKKVISTDIVDSVDVPAGKSVDLIYVLKDISTTSKAAYPVQIIFEDEKGTKSVVSFTVSITDLETKLAISPAQSEVIEVKRDSTLEGSFTVTNEGPVSLNGITAKYNGYSIVPSTFDLAVGESQLVTYQKNITKYEDSVSHSHRIEISHPYMLQKFEFVSRYEVESMIAFGDLEYKVDDERKKDIDSSIDVKPNSVVVLEIEVDNLFPRSSKIDMEDVEVSFDFGDLDIDVDDEEFDEEIDAGKSETIEVTLPKIPVDLEKGEYQVEIRVEAEDSEGINHQAEYAFEVEVKKDKHAITFDKVTFWLNEFIEEEDLPEKIELYVVDICNIGRSEEDVEIEFRSTKLGIQKIDEVEIEEDSSCYSEVYTFNVLKVSPGRYPIEVIVGNKYNDEIRKVVYLEVLGDANEEYEDIIVGKSGSTTKIQPDQIVNSGFDNNFPVEETTADKSSSEGLLIGVLIMCIVVMMGFIGVIGVKILRGY